MDVKLFQRTQRDLAAAINLVVDRYWEDEIEEIELIETVQDLYINNESKFIKSGDYTTVLRQQCGKRRLEVVSKVLSSQVNSR